jgi:hypothetical protein
MRQRHVDLHGITGPAASAKLAIATSLKPYEVEQLT